MKMRRLQFSHLSVVGFVFAMTSVVFAECGSDCFQLTRTAKWNGPFATIFKKFDDTICVSYGDRNADATPPCFGYTRYPDFTCGSVGPRQWKSLTDASDCCLIASASEVPAYAGTETGSWTDIDARRTCNSAGS